MPQLRVDAFAGSIEPNLAGFWWRALGFIIDSIIVALVTTLPLHQMSADFYVAAVVTLAITFLYFFLLITYWNGATIGMRVASIRCVDMKDRGSVGLRQSAIRSAAYTFLVAIGSFYHYTIYKNPTTAQSHQEGKHVAVAFCLLVPHLLDLLWVAWDNKNQTLHDKAAGTLVIRDDKSVAQSLASGR